jgi:hypothetical protein
MKIGESFTSEQKQPDIYTVTYDYNKLALASLLPFLTDEGQSKKVIKANSKLSTIELEKIKTRRLVETFNLSIISTTESFLAVWSGLVKDKDGVLICEQDEIMPEIFSRIETLRSLATDLSLKPIETVIPIPEYKKPKTLLNAFRIEEANRQLLMEVYQQAIIQSII